MVEFRQFFLNDLLKTKPVGLIESFWAPPQTPGRLRHNNVARGSALRPPLGLRPKPRSGGGLGWSPQQRSYGEAAPGFGAEPQPPPPPPLLATALGVVGGVSTPNAGRRDESICIVLPVTLCSKTKEDMTPITPKVSFYLCETAKARAPLILVIEDFLPGVDASEEFPEFSSCVFPDDPGSPASEPRLLSSFISMSEGFAEMDGLGSTTPSFISSADTTETNNRVYYT